MNKEIFGLPEHIVTLLHDYFAMQPEVVRVFLFGSRAMGNHQRGSDIDLAIISSASQDISGRIALELDALPTAYLFDVVDYHFLQHAGLKHHIDTIGKVFLNENK